MSDSKVFAWIALGGVALYLLNASQTSPELRAAVPGVPAVPVPVTIPGIGNKQSLVTPSFSTNTLATNINNIGQAANSLLNKLVMAITGSSNPGNSPEDPAPSFSMAPIATGNAVASLPGVPSVGSTPLRPDYSVFNNDPFFGWGLD